MRRLRPDPVAQRPVRPGSPRPGRRDQGAGPTGARRVERPAGAEPLAFCVSISHADYMAEFFTAGASPRRSSQRATIALRHQAVDQLRNGDAGGASSPSTSSTKVSTSPRSTPSSCFDRPSHPSCSSSSWAEGSAPPMARTASPSSTSSATTAASSSSPARCSASGLARPLHCSGARGHGDRRIRAPRDVRRVLRPDPRRHVPIPRPVLRP